MTLVTVGALKPDARTKSAFEHGPVSRRSLSKRCAFVWRSRGGLATKTGSFFTVQSPTQISLAGVDGHHVTAFSNARGIIRRGLPS